MSCCVQYARSTPHYALARNALVNLRLRNEVLCIAPQNLVEFWAVATRSQDENGLGMTAEQTAKELSHVRDFFRLLPYTPEVIQAWERIVAAQGVSGKQTHDAHLVAIMQAHSVSIILTFNEGHFKRFPGIMALHPSEI